MSSPRLRILMARPKNIAIITAAIIPIAGSLMARAVTPLSVPIINVVILRVISLSISFIVLIPAPRREDIVMPARIMVVLDWSPMYAIANTRSVVISAPANANTEE